MLNAENLIIEYPDGTRAIDKVSFSISEGENVALIGANGAGKTTLMLSLVGILMPVSGEIYLNDIKLEKKTLRQIRSGIGMVFQNPDDQLFMPNIFEDAAFGPRNFGCTEEEAAKRVNTALSMLGIEHLAKKSPLKLSGGEKRLAAISTVLSMEPEFLLFDEPTAFLDPRAKRNMTTILKDLPQGKIIATHDTTFASTICTRVLLLQNGKLVADEGIDLLNNIERLEAAGL
jgi:cobalt/nickel transport system ATP-binding protein